MSLPDALRRSLAIRRSYSPLSISLRRLLPYGRFGHESSVRNNAFRCFSLAPKIDPSFISYKTTTKLKQFNAGLTKQIKSLQKKMKDDVDEVRVATLTGIMESRGFELTWDEDDSTLYLQKQSENETIIVSIYQEEENTAIQIRILKSNDEESQDLVPVTIHCLEKKEELGLVTIEINELESSDVYGCPDFNYLDDPIKVAFMTYLKELGIDDEVAKLAAAITRQQIKHNTYHFLQDIRSFINDDPSIGSGSPSDLPSLEKRQKEKKGKERVNELNTK